MRKEIAQVMVLGIVNVQTDLRRPITGIIVVVLDILQLGIVLLDPTPVSASREQGVKVKYFTIPRNKNFRLIPVEDISMSDKIKSNPDIVLREEYDDWAVFI
jgi:hypothetical protein